MLLGCREVASEVYPNILSRSFRTEIEQQVIKLLDLVQIGWLGKRYTNQLSGQRQR
jgi:ABC-type sulfate/molybdate transport systems ATPase subunit